MATLYMSLNKKELDRLNEVSNITEIDYEIKDSSISMDNYSGMIEDLLNEYHKLQEEFEDFKQDVADNYEYKKLNPYKEYGVSEHDFY